MQTGAAIDSTTTEPSRITSSTHKNQEEGDGGGGGGSLHAAGRMSKDDGGALVEFLLQQRLPFYGTRDDGVVVIDKCSLSLKVRPPTAAVWPHLSRCGVARCMRWNDLHV